MFFCFSSNHIIIHYLYKPWLTFPPTSQLHLQLCPVLLTQVFSGTPSQGNFFSALHAERPRGGETAWRERDSSARLGLSWGPWNTSWLEGEAGNERTSFAVYAPVCISWNRQVANNSVATAPPALAALLWQVIGLCAFKEQAQPFKNAKTIDFWAWYSPCL